MGDRAASELSAYKPPELIPARGNIPTSFASSENLLRVHFVLCRVLQPNLVIETGVATGTATALLLREIPSGGQLISIEMPALGQADLSYIGSRVPFALRTKWRLIIGAAVPVLNVMREELSEKADIFIHDSDHSYHNQLQEYRIAAKLLRPGGVLVSDDVANDAFAEACAALHADPIIAQGRTGCIGIAVKPAR